MQRWVSFGASGIGPAHITTGKPNQDSWAAFHHGNCDVLVVSDGMGSKDLSEFGSAMACRAVDQAVCRALLSSDALNLKEPSLREEFLNNIKDIWLEGIVPLTSHNASATCLFGFRAGDGMVWVGMLGDGLAVAILNDGSARLLEDVKSESFSNMTQSLSERTLAGDWKLTGIPENRCKAILLCTDGVSDDLVDAEGFACGLVDAFCKLPVITASSQAADMLVDWPTPKHSDDKTIACLFKREYSNE